MLTTLLVSAASVCVAFIGAKLLGTDAGSPLQEWRKRCRGTEPAQID